MAEINKRFFFKNMEKVDNLEEFAKKELAFIEKLIETEQTPHEINLTFEGAPTHAHNRAELHVVAGKLNLYAAYEDADMFKAVKEACDKMAQELRRAKDEQKDAYKIKDDFFKGA